MNVRQCYILVAVLLFCFFIAATTSMVQKSPTWDEPVHLAAGYSYLVTRDFRYNVEHPPLIKMLAALPLLALHLHPVGPSVGPWDNTDAATRAGEIKFVFQNSRPAQSIVFWGRLPIVLLGATVAVFVYRWTEGLAGPAAGFLALILYVFDPNLLAHTQVVTMDMGLAGCFAVALYAVVRYLTRPTATTLWAAAAAFAVAMLVKFTAVALVPIYALLCIVRNSRCGVAAAWSSLWRVTVAMGCATVGLAFVAYAFQIGVREVNWDLVRFFQAHTGSSSIPVRAILKLSHLPRPAPDFWEGLSSQLKNGAYEERFAYLNGQRYRGARLDYLPVAFLVKTPVPTLALASLALGVFTYRLARGTKPPPSFDEIAIVAAMIAFFASSMLVRANLGLRYLLPLYPLLFIFIALQLAWLHAAAAGRRLLISLIIVGLLSYSAFSSVRSHPDYLAYFNEPSGGAQNGWKHLAESNLDWGQDLPGLKAYLARQGVDHVYLRYYGTALPDAYGIHWTALPTNQEAARRGVPRGLVAVSVSALLLQLPPDSWVWKYHPITTIGRSIWIFDLRPGVGAR